VVQGSTVIWQVSASMAVLAVLPAWDRLTWTSCPPIVIAPRTDTAGSPSAAGVGGATGLFGPSRSRDRAFAVGAGNGHPLPGKRQPGTDNVIAKADIA
jgi:hypothetical protein